MSDQDADSKVWQAVMVLHRTAEGTTPMLSAPCVFCAYSGAGYYQAGTHEKACPWFGIGGAAERDTALRHVIHNLAVAVRRSALSAVSGAK